MTVPVPDEFLILVIRDKTRCSSTQVRAVVVVATQKHAHNKRLIVVHNNNY